MPKIWWFALGANGVMCFYSLIGTLVTEKTWYWLLLLSINLWGVRHLLNVRKRLRNASSTG